MPRYIDADELKKRMLNYYDCLKDANKSNYRGETLMNYEVADMIEDCIDNAPTANVVELPCKVGDIVWFETWKKNATECIGIRPHTVDRIDVIAVCDIEGITPTKLHDWEFGKNVFLTQEEAEKAVKIMEGE